MRKGLDIDEFAPGLSFFFNSHVDSSGDRHSGRLEDLGAVDEGRYGAQKSDRGC